MEKRELLEDWYFRLNDEETYKEILFDHSDWEPVRIPHDWSLPLGFSRDALSGPRGGYVQTGTGWYRKIIPFDDLNDKRVIIRFDGVFMNSTVYLNGTELGHRPYGYSSFAYDLTDNLNRGANVLAVRVDCSRQPASRWYNGCGIYRPVHLLVSGQVRTVPDGVCVTTPSIEEDKALIRCEYTLDNGSDHDREVTLVHRILSSPLGDRADATVSLVLKKGETKGHIELALPSPELWSPDHPGLYTHVLEIFENNELLDSHETRFGVRTLDFVGGKGFFLNGENLKFKGVCLHHDAGVMGAALSKGLIHKRLTQLKNMGCNAVRTAHNPFSSSFYDLCDELGLMVMDEIFDGWEEAKADNDYGRYFDSWWDRDLTDWVIRDRNHPCVVMWSLGNEVHNMNPKTTVKLRNRVHELDPTRPVTCGVQGTGQDFDNNRALLDVAGYNDGGGACFIYDGDHEKRPDQLFIATEAPHTFQTRGFYRTQTWWRDKNQPRREIENLAPEEIFFDGSLHYYSSYDNAGVRNCARDSWEDSEKRDYLMGEFRWTGYDYHGESMGWPARMFPSGVIDTANFEKDHYYLYKSMWSTEPMVHMLPHWTHLTMKEGIPIPVWVYTNCAAAELFLNGDSLGRKEKGQTKELSWDVPWTPGILEVCAYGRNGDILCRDKRETAGTPDMLEVTWEPFEGDRTGQMNVSILSGGHPVPHGGNAVVFTAREEEELLGTDNGDPIDLTPSGSSVRRAFYGKAMALFRMNEKHDTPRALISALLGDLQFTESTEISLAAGLAGAGEVSYISDLAKMYGPAYKKMFPRDKGLSLRGEISLNGGEFQPYREALVLKDTALVKARIYEGDTLLVEQSQLFSRGEKEPVIDLIHGNRVLDLERTIGPFSEEVSGEWGDGMFRFLFEKDGDFSRLLEGGEKQHLGTWWYDFPVDYLEVPDYAGQGEIWFNTGEKAALSLKDQSARELVMDNKAKAIGSMWAHAAELRFRRPD